MIQIYIKTHQIASFYKKISGEHAPKPPITKRMAFKCAACRCVTCNFPNLKKIILGRPLPKPGYAPGGIVSEIMGTYYHILIELSCGAYNAVHRYCQGIRGYALPNFF